jgi:hypothetical protein
MKRSALPGVASKACIRLTFTRKHNAIAGLDRQPGALSWGRPVGSAGRFTRLPWETASLGTEDRISIAYLDENNKIYYLYILDVE